MNQLKQISATKLTMILLFTLITLLNSNLHSMNQDNKTNTINLQSVQANNDIKEIERLIQEDITTLKIEKLASTNPYIYIAAFGKFPKSPHSLNFPRLTYRILYEYECNNNIINFLDF